MIWLEDVVWSGSGEGGDRSRREGRESAGNGEREGAPAPAAAGDGAPAPAAPAEPAGEKPWRKKAAEGGGSERPQVQRPEGMGRVYSIRAGSFPGRPDSPEFLKDAAVWVMTPDGNTRRVEATSMGRRGPTVSVSAKGGGFYHVLAYADAGVKNGARLHLYSRASFMSHGDHLHPVKSPEVAEGAGFFQGDPILNVEQLGLSERQMRAATGQTLRVRVSFKGQPLAQKDVSIVTQQNWRQTKRTDANGEASFILIKEDFPDAGERRRASKYLVVADHSEETAGEMNGEQYNAERHVATLSLSVYPSPWEWESRSMAYMVIVTSIIVSGGAIAIRRSRRRRKAK